MLLILKLIPDWETSQTWDNSFFPSALSSVSFTSISWQLNPEEEVKLRTSASLLHRDVAGILTQGVRVIWQDKPHVLSERSKNVPPSLWLVSSVHHSVFSLTATHCVGGIEMECPVKQSKEGREGKRRREKSESDPWPLRPHDVSGAGRGRNWEWHSWLELPNCHFLSSLFTHSRSLSWTFEEQRTDMCLLVQPSLLTVIIVVHSHSLKITIQSHLPNKDRRIVNVKEKTWRYIKLCFLFYCNELKYEAFFAIIVLFVQLLKPPLVCHWIWKSSVAQCDQIARELEKLDS